MAVEASGEEHREALVVADPAPPADPPRAERRPGVVVGLDGLRALAAFAVIAYHVQFLARGATGPAPAASAVGWVGVDLFFAISGFILMVPFARAHGSGARTDLRRFYTRRARRIVPGFWLNLAILALLAGPALLLSGRGWATVAADATFVAGYLGYPSLNAVYWSLYCETAFYLVLPFLAKAFVGRRWWWGLPAAIALGAGFRWAVVTFVESERYFTPIMQFPGVIDQFAFGMVAAVLWVRVEREPARVPGWLLAALAAVGTLGALAITLLIQKVLTLDAFWTASTSFGPWPLVFLRPGLSLCFALVIVGVCLRPNPVRSVLDHRVVRYLGVISFGLYLWHLPITRELVPYLGSTGGSSSGYVLRFAVVAALSVACAAASYHLVERRFLGRREVALNHGRVSEDRR